jgi:hypothetical protein
LPLCAALLFFPFSENLYLINDKSGRGYINREGVIILEQKYNFAERFSSDYAVVQDKNLKI